MYCPSCGKTIPDESKFCLHCGINIVAPRTSQQVSAVQWEYKELIIPNDKFPEKYVMKAYGYMYEPRALENLWLIYQPQLPTVLREELAQGWELDPAFLIPSCIAYKKRRRTIKDWYWWEKLLWLFLTLVSFGIALLWAIPLAFISGWIMEPTSVKVLLRRSKTV